MGETYPEYIHSININNGKVFDKGNVPEKRTEGVFHHHAYVWDEVRRVQAQDVQEVAVRRTGRPGGKDQHQQPELFFCTL